MMFFLCPVGLPFEDSQFFLVFVLLVILDFLIPSLSDLRDTSIFPLSSHSHFHRESQSLGHEAELDRIQENSNLAFVLPQNKLLYLFLINLTRRKP